MVCQRSLVPLGRGIPDAAPRSCRHQRAAAGPLRFAIDRRAGAACAVDRRSGCWCHQPELVGPWRFYRPGGASHHGRDARARHPRGVPPRALPRRPISILPARHPVPAEGIRRAPPLGLLAGAAQRRRQVRSGLQVVPNDSAALRQGLPRRAPGDAGLHERCQLATAGGERPRDAPAGFRSHHAAGRLAGFRQDPRLWIRRHRHLRQLRQTIRVACLREGLQRLRSAVLLQLQSGIRRHSRAQRGARLLLRAAFV